MKKNTNTNINDYRTVAKCFNEWIRYESSSKSVHTISSYKTALRIYLVEYLANVLNLVYKTFDINKAFSATTIMNWMKWMRDVKNCSAQTVNHRHSSLLSFLSYLGKMEPLFLTFYLEAKEIHKHRVKHVKVHGFTTEALTALLNAPNTSTKTGYRDSVLLSLLYATGARINELLTVHLRDVRISKNGKPSYITFNGKGNKYRCIPLLTPSIAHLEKYIKTFHGENPSPDVYLFYSKSKGKYVQLSSRAIAYRLNKYAEIAHEKCEDVPLNSHSHQFRHTRATEWIRENHSVAVVSSLLGHASVETTMTYLDITPDMIAEAAKSVSSEQANAMQPKWKEDEDFTKLFNF